MKKKYEIYQLPVEHQSKFMGLEFVKEHEIMPRFTDYEKVWEGEIEVEGDKPAHELEEIFRIFQGVKPEGYTGTSVSVSDVVMIDGQCYYCDSFGWEPVDLIVETKTVSYNYKSFEVNLTTNLIHDIEHDVKIAKLNGRDWDTFIKNAYRTYSEWAEVISKIWQKTEIAPEVGMGATMNLWSDRRAMTVTKVISPKKIEVRENDTVCKDWYASSYDILPTLVGGTTVFTLRKNGTWVQEGQPKKFGSVTLTLGFRHHYIDPSF